MGLRALLESRVTGSPEAFLRNASFRGGSAVGMGKDRRHTGSIPVRPPEDPEAATLEDELEEAVDLLPQQEASEGALPPPPRLDPFGPTDYVDPSLIDPAD